MAIEDIRLLEAGNRPEWRAWLKSHHDSVEEIWLVFYKAHTGIKWIDYEAAVEEAICFGWVDSLIKRLDDERYARKFTPRKPNSKWSTVNRRRYARLQARGLLAPPGLERAPTERSGDAPRPSVEQMPAYIEARFKENPQAWAFFDGLAPSYKRAYIGWIDSAKREETRQKRLAEAVELLAAGKKLGLK